MDDLKKQNLILSELTLSYETNEKNLLKNQKIRNEERKVLE